MIRLEIMPNKHGVPVVVSPDIPGLKLSCAGLNDLWTEAQAYGERIKQRNSKKDCE